MLPFSIFMRPSLAFVWFVSICPLFATDVHNRLTAEERKAGWKLLFDGKTYKGWIDPAKSKPRGDSWTIEDGCLKAQPHPQITEDLFSRKQFKDFELAWQWKISPGGNSGVKYRIQDTLVLRSSKTPSDLKFEQSVGEIMQGPPASRSALRSGEKAQVYVIGFEYQMIDNSLNKDAQRGAKYQTAALYDMIPPAEDASKPVGDWNDSRLVVKGEHIEHWLNGKKVVDASLKAPEIAAGTSKRWAPAPKLERMLIDHPKASTPISLQNHGNNAWFRDIKIRPL